MKKSKHREAMANAVELVRAGVSPSVASSIASRDCFKEVSRGTQGALTGRSFCDCPFPSGACLREKNT